MANGLRAAKALLLGEYGVEQNEAAEAIAEQVDRAVPAATTKPVDGVAIRVLAPRRRARMNMPVSRSAMSDDMTTPGDGEGPAALGGVLKRTL